MKTLTLLLLSAALALASQAGLETVVLTDQDGINNTYFRINTGTDVIDDFDVLGVEPPRAPADTGVLWVDRNHQDAIAYSVAISGDGKHVFNNWSLNNERAGYYRTLATNIPIWESPGEYPWMYGGRQIGVSEDGSVLALSTQKECRRWSRNSPYPEWTHVYPQAGLNGFSRVSFDGTTVATVQGGMLYIIDAVTGEVWDSVPVSEPTRLQGLDISDDGGVTAVTLYDSCLVFDENGRRAAIPIGSSTSGTQYAAALSGDGSLIVTGDYQGRCRLFRWNGSTYENRWTAQVGTPWCAGIAISRDGSTVAVGTGYNDGKLCVFDSSSATPLWVYQGYGSQGAYVPCIAISGDGSRIAAASWGDRAPSGTFKVFTVHNRGDSTPIFGITRDEEPGSIFSCDISDDGTFAVCGGKAVHAQVMGSGGEVYAVIIGASEPTNVGMQAITSPPRHLQVGTQVNPQATVMNYGDAPATFWTYLEIDDNMDSLIYRDSTQVTGLDPGQTDDVSFSAWTPGYYGQFDCRFYTALAGDQYPGDDTLAMNSRCFHDARPERIGPPNDENTVGMPTTPVVLVRNNGSYPGSIPCGLVLTDSSGTVVYDESTTTAQLLPDSAAAVTMPQFTPGDVGPYTATAWTALGEDFVPGNDSFQRDFQVTYEIIYDNGSWEGFYWVGRQDNDKFFVRFTPTLSPPFSITGGRVYVNMANTPFDYVMVCTGTQAKPDTLDTLQVVHNVAAPVAPGWAEFDLDITRQEQGDLWLVCHWPPGSPAMGVGADADAPIDLRSYFSSNQDTFRLWSTHDWMMRLTQSPQVGVAGHEPLLPALRLDRAGPNPFRHRVSIRYSTPAAGQYRLSLYDPVGRHVALLADGFHTAGEHTARWSDQTRRPSYGLLFARLTRLETGETRTLKLIGLD